ncbi:MAG: methyltransferase domain-containing protein [Bacteroidales bacterium]|nr:methyltransferase domain-containing protein [Bacteroidales bacterium]
MKYDFAIEQHPQTIYILNQIKENQSILEFGCHSGRLSKLLINKNCNVLGFDNDDSALIEAKQKGVNAFNVNLNDINSWMSIIKNTTFDTLIIYNI